MPVFPWEPVFLFLAELYCVRKTPTASVGVTNCWRDARFRIFGARIGPPLRHAGRFAL